MVAMHMHTFALPWNYNNLALRWRLDKGMKVKMWVLDYTGKAQGTSLGIKGLVPWLHDGDEESIEQITTSYVHTFIRAKGYY